MDGLPLKRVFSSLSIVTFAEPSLVNWRSVLVSLQVVYGLTMDLTL